MIDFLESTEANFMKKTLEDEDNSDEQDNGSVNDNYHDVIRIMRLYRAPKQLPELSLLEKLDLIDSLCEGDEDKMAEIFTTLKIDPAAGYKAIEEDLVKRLKQ